MGLGVGLELGLGGGGAGLELVELGLIEPPPPPQAAKTDRTTHCISRSVRPVVDVSSRGRSMSVLTSILGRGFCRIACALRICCD